METEVSGTIERNEAGRLRVSRIEVRLAPELEEADAARVKRCVDLFEDFCTVTQSVRQGIDIDAVVEPKIAAPEPAACAAARGVRPSRRRGAESWFRSR